MRAYQSCKSACIRNVEKDSFFTGCCLESKSYQFDIHLYVYFAQKLMMAANRPDDDIVLLDPRRNQGIEKKKLFEEMLLKEISGKGMGCYFLL